MPIQNREDAVEVEDRINRIFAATPGQRAAEVRGLFSEVLDFNPASGQASLVSVQAGVSLPDAADRIAELDGIHVLYIAMPLSDTDRVRKAEVDAAAKLLANQLSDDLLLVFTNPSANQLHVILPTFAGSRPTLRRMVVDRDLPRRTAVQQVSNIYWNWQGRGSIRAALEETFDVEPVTRDFFAEYKRIFEAAEASVSGFEDTAEGREERRFFVQTLFNRLMFVYFLQRKGWLTFHSNKDYVNALWQDYHAQPKHGDFYTTRLQPLFFSGLNNPDPRELPQGLENLIGDVPFLNGGLFEQTDLDRRKGIDVSDSAFEQVLRDLFDRFNFTVMESTPFDVEVAVDPEMLGKVFEELVTGRHDSGAYYTPRPVVSFMCREALKGYLEGQDTGLEAEVIARFVDRHDTDGIGVAQARRLAEALAEVTVVDPACGSGAYLLGMMQELIELQVRLFNVTQDAKSLYDLKLEIIQRNLYGVDIDDFAVNIAMLRLWLSLAIDYEGATPEPLPNLDFKVVCGDSLLGPDPSSGAEVQVVLGQDVERVRLLGQRKREYLRASTGADKDRLRGEIAELAAAIQEENGSEVRESVVDWRVQFAEVFAEDRRGFDIAIANPPYVNMVTMDKTDTEYRAVLKSIYATARGGFDIFVPFVERGIQILSSAGLMAYITPNKLLAAEYAKSLRSFLVESTQLISLTDLSDVSVFTASVYPVVFVTSKTREPNCESLVGIYNAADRDIGSGHVEFVFSASPSIASQFGNLWSPYLAYDAEELLPLLEKCERLGDFATISGAATVSEAYEWKDSLIDEGQGLLLGDPDRYRPFVVSGNLRSYFHTWESRSVQYIKHKYNKPVLDTSHQSISKTRREQIKREKVIVSGMSKRPIAVYDRNGIAAGKSTILISATKSEDNLFICGLLNSDIVQRIYSAMYGSLALAGGYLRFGPPQIKEIPIPKANQEERGEIADLVLERGLAGDSDVAEYERKINEAVSKLYGMSL